MKLATILALLFISLIANAKSTYTIHYLGDTKPITIDVPVIINKDGNNTQINKKLVFVFDDKSTLGLNADFSVEIEGNNIQIEATSINKSIIKAEVNNQDAMNTKINVIFLASEEVLSPIANGMTDPEIQNGLLSFVAGNLSNENLYNLSLKITQKKFLKKDELIIDTKVKLTDMVVEKVSETQNRYTIDLNKISNGKYQANRKNEIEMVLALKYDFKNVVNVKQLGRVAYSKSISSQEIK